MKIHSNLEQVTTQAVSGFCPQVKIDRHKFEAGSVAAWVGSPGMVGAAGLSCLGALRGGAGFVRLLHAASLLPEFSHIPMEVVRQSFSEAASFQVINEWFHSSRSWLIGCGLGRKKQVEQRLRAWVPCIHSPLVLDADALFFYAQKPFALPASTIFTPHLGELARLLSMEGKIQQVDTAFLHLAMEYTHST